MVNTGCGRSPLVNCTGRELGTGNELAHKLAGKSRGKLPTAKTIGKVFSPDSTSRVDHRWIIKRLALYVPLHPRFPSPGIVYHGPKDIRDISPTHESNSPSRPYMITYNFGFAMIP